ncbi:sugar kinase [Levilactobacillus senmaizukei DSM 21775 = NBRC 103853]|uniref:ADP-dependent (S)-NAD(P)H-hydrate dehydratase n=1 Tax=Levilactobacillus senmaizukei DSM 21775 = NBRC 103853 TaxID=1423803 RepID=A0A0R2DN64_9LACO|nr:NAD(P)H-hydrate dehydratase [Levilactobacillus senmaizukei]KRN01610.1 sugar kinase [Levilactobacillus senmaizukei DSM 21775 = NBRC 103853]
METLTAAILPQTIRKRPANSHKGTYGRVVLIGGNDNFGGAIIMASAAAIYSGAGLVTTVTAQSNQTSLHDRVPEAMFADITDTNLMASLITAADTVVIGPGLGTTDHSRTVLITAFKNICPDQRVVIDGSAITLIATDQVTLPKAHLIFTPHQMEWQRLSGIAIADQTPDRNRQIVDRLPGIVVLKSHHTEIYTATGSYRNPLGTPAQATGGMGDTLAGMVGGFVAQFADESQAVLAAVYTHSAIAEELATTQYVVLPHQIITEIPRFMKTHSEK